MFDAFARRMSDNYALFLYALTGRYQQLRSPGISVSPRSVSDLERDVHNLARTFYAIANKEIDDLTSPMIEDGSEELLSGLVERKLLILAFVRGLLAENVHQVIYMAKTGTYGISRMMQAHGALGLLIQRQAGVIKFLATDTSRRKWEAKQLFAVAMRDFAYQCELDFTLDQIKESGATAILVVYPDDARNFVMDIVDLTAEKRASIFHPNSKATVVAYVPS